MNDDYTRHDLPAVPDLEDDGYGWGNHPGRHHRTVARHTAPYPMHPGYQGVIAPKSPGIALLLSALFPGVGSMYAGKVGKGVALLAGYIVGWLLTGILVGFVVVPLMWVWAMVASYNDAVAWNAKHGIKS